MAYLTKTKTKTNWWDLEQQSENLKKVAQRRRPPVRGRQPGLSLQEEQHQQDWSPSWFGRFSQTAQKFIETCKKIELQTFSSSSKSFTTIFKKSTLTGIFFHDVLSQASDLLRHNILSDKSQESVWKWSSSHKWSCTHTVLYPQQGFSQPSLSLSPLLGSRREAFICTSYTPLAQLIILTQYIMTLGNWNDQTRKSWERVEQEAFSRTGHGIVDIEP